LIRVAVPAILNPVLRLPGGWRTWLLLLCCLWGGTAFAQAAPQSRSAEAVEVHVFWRVGCPHCENARDFLGRAAPEHGLRLREYEIGDPANLELFRRAVTHFHVANPAVPLVVIGPYHWVGYGSDDGTGAQFIAAAQSCRTARCDNVMASLIAGEANPAASPSTPVEPPPRTLRLPIVGEVELATLSLPALTVLLAAIDGFNPCAMWTLLFLMGLLVGIGDRMRMWTLGAAFIMTSALVYYLFLAAWLNLLLFLGVLLWVRVAVGLLAIGGGAWYLREFFVNPEALCKVTGAQSRQRVLQRLREVALERRFWLALAGIIALAVAVNLVEFICSAGIPAVYVQVLTLSALPAWQYHAYLLLYILVFMLDDLLIFVIAMKTLQVTGLTGRYARWSHLIGGGLLLLIGILLLLRPEWLSF
jgi:glutaredoxin